MCSWCFDVHIVCHVIARKALWIANIIFLKLKLQLRFWRFEKSKKLWKREILSLLLVAFSLLFSIFLRYWYFKENAKNSFFLQNALCLQIGKSHRLETAMRSIQICLVEEFLKKVLVSRQRSELNENEVEVC